MNDTYISVRQLCKFSGYSDRTLRNWIKKHDLQAPIKINGKIVGWKFSYIRSHKWLQHFFNEYTQHIEPKKEKRKTTVIITRKGIHNGYAVNCAIKMPSYFQILDKLVTSIDKVLTQCMKPVGIVLTLYTSGKKATNQIYRIKQKLAKKLNISDKKIWHWRKDEDGTTNGKHVHITLLFDTHNSPLGRIQIQRTIRDTVERLGALVYLNFSTKKGKKGVHFITTKQHIESFIFHASYLAKVKTAKQGHSTFRHSNNMI